MHCIYCGSEDLTEEHYLPACLGKFKDYIPLIDRICHKCNAICGKLDEQLCRSGGEAFFRVFLGIKGRKSHAKINPFYRGSAGAPALEMVGVSSMTGESTPLELISDREVRELRCIRLIANDDTEHLIRITDGMTPELFREKFDALQIGQFKKAIISASEQERDWVLSLIQSFKFESIGSWTSPPAGISYGPSTIKIQVTAHYFRDIAKIGFHYFLTKMSEYRGDEPCFSDIRNFIIKSSKLEEARKFITRSDDPSVWGIGPGERLNVWGHILSAETDYFNFVARVNLFAGPTNRPLIYNVRLGDNPSRIHHSRKEADFFVYFPRGERGVYDGEVVSMICVG